jgi:hypothetical protein
MPRRTVAGTGLTYHLVAFDRDGRERSDDPDGTMSRRAAQTLADEPVTDVFVFSHGWQGDVPAAVGQYDAWTGTMAAAQADVERARRVRPGFRPLLIGLHWPSLAWGEEELGGWGGAAASFSLEAGGAAAPATGPTSPMAEWVDAYAARLGDTPETRAALETIVAAAQADVAPPTLPPEVRRAVEVLNREADLGSAGPGGAPGDDRQTSDPEALYQAVLEDEGVSFAPGWLGGLLTLPRLLSFWKMKDLARRFGETGASGLLGDLRRAAGSGRDVRFHVMGHSFGCIVASAAVAGPPGGAPPPPVDSLVLVQGAMSLWSFCTSIPSSPDQRGYFSSVLAEHKVRGPVVVTTTVYDSAVGRCYPLGAGARQQVSFAPGELPTYGAVGTFGVRGPGPVVVDLELGPPDAAYAFAPGKVYNLECSGVIKRGGPPSGAHGDFLHPEVAHAVWSAALAGQD